MNNQEEREDFYILPEIPFKDEEVIENLSKIRNANAVKIDIDKCNFPSYHNLFVYLTNCGVKIGSINIRELENEKICELVKEYVKYDKILTFLNLNEIVASVIYTGKREFIQNDKFAEVEDIHDYIASERNMLSEADQQFMTVSLKVDEETQMRYVTEVKQALRRAYALKISYSSRKVDN